VGRSAIDSLHLEMFIGERRVRTSMRSLKGRRVPLSSLPLFDAVADQLHRICSRRDHNSALVGSTL
jgi:hypothetical protein